jgi:hypothetical protein
VQQRDSDTAQADVRQLTPVRVGGGVLATSGGRRATLAGAAHGSRRLGGLGVAHAGHTGQCCRTGDAGGRRDVQVDCSARTTRWQRRADWFGRHGRMQSKVGNCRAHGPRSPRHAGRMRAGTGELSTCGGITGRAADRLSGTRVERLGRG